MVSARTSATANAVHTDREPLRLKYKLRLVGRGQQTKLQAVANASDQPLSESEVKRLKNLHDLDVAIVRELRAGTVFGQLGDAQLARVLPLLAQRTTEIGDQRLRVVDEPLTPRLSMTTDERGKVMVTLRLADQDGDTYDIDNGRLLAGSQAYFLVGHRAYPIDSQAPWELASWSLQATKDLTGRLSPDERDSLVARLAKAGVPEEDLAHLAVGRGPPDGIIAKVTAENSKEPRVAITLYADYRGERVPLGGHSPASPYVITQGGGGSIIERDLALEDGVRRLMRGLRFRYDREADAFRGKDELALAALDPRSNIFPEAWEIDRAEAPPFLRDLILNAEVKLLEDKGLLDLNIDIAAVTDDDDATAQALVDMKDLLAWLQSGKSYLRLKDGAWVAPSAQFRQGLKVLDDLGAESHRALISPLCVGLLRMIGDSDAVRAADSATQAWLSEISGESEPAPTLPPDELAPIMRDYQRRGLDWLGMLHRHRLTGILADDMGLGKTLQTLALLSRVREQEGPKPSLVVAPTSVVTVWRDEAERFTPNLKVGLLHGPPKARHAIDLQNMDLLITSYGVLRRDAERLAEVQFRYVILDEAQAAKNAGTQNAKAVRRLTSERRLALSGTPIENRPEELWATFDFLAPGFLGSLRQFRKRYARPISRGEEDSLALLRGRVQPLVLRRLKQEVAKELPPKIESTIRCEMDRAQRALYDHVAGQLRDSVMQKIEKVGIERAHLDILAALTRLRQICCDPALLPAPDGMRTPPSAKLELFEELMREALESDRRVLVFSQFVKMQRRLIDVITQLGVEPLWLHGGTRNRDKVVASFQDPNGPPVIVVSLKAGGTGLTLTRADTVMHYDPWWNPAVERQATDRTHRLGQTQTVTVYKLICQGTIEEKVLKMAAAKDELAAALISSEGSAAPKHITVDEVMALLS